ncbi:helix-turn-helix domain-containing protein [Pseudomonas fildesensis]|uniref:helix-turn-helix domain-containing protein n=1 Tax=Pseudomonas fildesensis TaxID=1674920 RepID=UPI00387B92B9
MPPKYTNAGGQPREKCMVAAYALVKNYGATQATVATVMGCSQATVANWVKEVGFQKEISGLKGELTGARDYIDNLADQLNLIEYDPTDYED